MPSIIALRRSRPRTRIQVRRKPEAFTPSALETEERMITKEKLLGIGIVGVVVVALFTGGGGNHHSRAQQSQTVPEFNVSKPSPGDREFRCTQARLFARDMCNNAA